jgi:hypothetical protein
MNAANQLEWISKINTAAHLGNNENYTNAIYCMQKLMECRAEIAMRCRNFDMPDDTRELYYQLLTAYNEDIKKLLGL